MAKLPLGSSRIIVALDFPDFHEAFVLAEKLGKHVWGFKVGLELIHGEKGGPFAVQAIQGWASSNIFYDCKLHDTPSTAGAAAHQIAGLQISMFNVHCLGGEAMMMAAKVAATKRAEELGIKRPLVLGVTILTSLDYNALARMKFHVSKYYDKFYLEGIPSVETKRLVIGEIAVELAKLAREAGLDGVVASAQEAPMVRKACGPDFLIVTPGIRLPGAEVHDQKRVMTPQEAIAAGADLLVVGRDITKAADPVAAVRQYNEAVAEVLEQKAKDELRMTHIGADETCPICGRPLLAGEECPKCNRTDTGSDALAGRTVPENGPQF